jgi:hypothetical protein
MRGPQHLQHGALPCKQQLNIDNNLSLKEVSHLLMSEVTGQQKSVVKAQRKKILLLSMAARCELRSNFGELHQQKHWSQDS